LHSILLLLPLLPLLALLLLLVLLRNLVLHHWSCLNYS
jgi:hypothetical protein